MREFSKDQLVTHPSFKDSLTICCKVNNDWYLCYSSTKRHSVVLATKELKICKK
jgi:hypothetical protein